MYLPATNCSTRLSTILLPGEIIKEIRDMRFQVICGAGGNPPYFVYFSAGEDNRFFRCAYIDFKKLRLQISRAQEPAAQSKTRTQLDSQPCFTRIFISNPEASRCEHGPLSTGQLVPRGRPVRTTRERVTPGIVIEPVTWAYTQAKVQPWPGSDARTCTTDGLPRSSGTHARHMLHGTRARSVTAAAPVA